MGAGRPSHAEPPSGRSDRVSVLDDALWSRFDQSNDLDDFCRTWLALQVKRLGHVAAGVVVLDRGDGLVPMARWPQQDEPDRRLVDAVELAVERAAPAAIGGEAIAIPLKPTGAVAGVAALVFEPPPGDLQERARELRWGVGWLSDALRARSMAGDAAERARMGAVLDLLGAVLDAEGFRAAAMAGVNLLARQTAASHVAVGLRHGRGLKLEALSDVADFRLNTGRTRALESAMMEAVDQAGSVLYPPRPDQEFVVDRAHRELARQTGAGDVMTVPLCIGETVAGALHLQTEAGDRLSVDDITIAEGAAATLGPLLVEKARQERPLPTALWLAVVAGWRSIVGPGYLGRKTALAVLALLIAVFSVAEGDFRVKARSEVQGQVLRSMTAPFDGNVADQFVRAGDDVRAGDPLAALDERDLRIELARARTEAGRYEGEYDLALADRNATEARIAAANRAEALARVELLTLQLDKAVLRAPFDAVIISGDLSQSLGSAVRRGEELFQIAPLDRYRVRLDVEETDFDEIEIGQTGSLVLNSLPGERFRVRVSQITPSFEAREGRNVALVEARIVDGGEQIRPGMRGVAKIDVERRLLIRIWTQPLVDWLRLFVWRWTP